MSRRESRASLSGRQVDALQEFEAFKRKFLQYNKQIAKVNSQLQIKIEELNVQISKQTVENFALQAKAISLERELKKERMKSKHVWQGNAISETDAAAAFMIKQLEALRSSFELMRNSHPTSSPSPKATASSQHRARPSVSNRINLIARAPDVSLINEGDSEEEAQVQEQPARRSPSPVSPAPVASSSTSSNTLRRKPSRRQSGILKSTQVQSTPAPLLLPTSNIGESDIDDGVEADGDEDELMSASTVSRSKSSSKHKAKPVAETEMTLKAKEKPKRAGGLVDVTNSPPRRGQPLLQKGILSVLAEESGDDRSAPPMKALALESKKVQRVEPSKHSPDDNSPSSEPETPHPRRQSPLTDTPAPATNNETQGGRSTRVRKSVNYAEPKLNTKMRKPEDPMPPSALLSATPFYTVTDYVSPPTSTGSTGSTARPIKPLPASISAQRKSTGDNEESPAAIPSGRRKSPSPSTSTTPSPPTGLPSDDDDEAEVEKHIHPGDESDEEIDIKPRKRVSKLGTGRSSTLSSSAVDKASGSTVASKSAPSSTSRIVPPVDWESRTASQASTSKIQKARSSSLASRKPFVPTSSSTETTPTSTSSSTTASPIEAVAVRKRKAIPVHYRYEDISDEDETAGEVDDDGEYVEASKERRRTVGPGAKSKTKASASESAKDRRHSVAL